ncbi:MAG: hypothetical protein Q9225_003794 [Loekoesia sp. 1 TL-2023]
MHDSAPEKLHILEQARDSYSATTASLPSMEKPPGCEEDLDHVATLNEFGSTTTSALQTPTNRSSMQHCKVFSPFSPMPPKRFTRKSIGALIPSPLHIQKDARILDIPTTPSRSKTTNQLHDITTQMGKAPPYTPPRNIIPSIPSSSGRLSVTFSASSYTWLQQRFCERYNASRADFADMLQGHIAAVENLISEVKDLQANGSIKRRISFGEDREARTADLRERVVRLRARRWQRERFAPERYRKLCAMALAEL